MKVTTYGQKVFYADQPVFEGRIYCDQTPDSLHVRLSSSQLFRASDSEQCFVDINTQRLAPSVVSPTAAPCAGYDCVNNLQLRSTLLKVSSFLQRVAPDRVVVHNDPVSSRLQRRLDDGLEGKAFVAFDVEHLIDQWGEFRAWFPDVAPTVRASSANHLVLAALVHGLGVRVDVDSPSDVAQLAACVECVSTADACSQHILATRADFVAACGVDTAAVRTVSGIRKSLLRGVSSMCVGSISGIRGISAAIRSAPKGIRSSLISPGLILSLRASQSVDVPAGFVAGSSLLKSQFSFSYSEGLAALKEARRLDLSVVGIQVDVTSLLDGTVKLFVAQLLSAQRNKDGLTIVLDGIHSLLSSNENSLIRKRADAALIALRADCGATPLRILADISHHLLGSNQLLMTRVIGARPSVGDDGSIVGRQLYVDDGIYGSLCSRTKVASTPAFSVGYELERPLPYLVKQGEHAVSAVETMYDSLPCTIWGQTCDSLDKVMVTAAGQLPVSLGLGDWLSFLVPMCCGNATNTGFNGYDAPLTRFLIHTGFE